MYHYPTSCTLFVSQKIGNDRNTGLSSEASAYQNGPIATLSEAFSRIGVLRSNGIMQPYTIKLLDAETEITSPVIITARETSRDTEQVPSNVTVEPAFSGKAKICGGKKVTGFAEDTFNGVACFSTTVKNDGNVFTDLYVNDRPAFNTRYPEEGFFTPEDVDNHKKDLMGPSDWFIAHPGDIPDDVDLSAAIISFGHYWIDEHSSIKEYDKETRKVTLESATRFSIAPENGLSAAMQYYIENLPMTFKNPGEWYYDRKNEKLYYIPRDESETKDTIEVYIPYANSLINIRGTKEMPADGIRFRRIHFTITKGDYSSIGFPRTHGTGPSAGTGLHAFVNGKAYASDLQACSDMHGAINMTYAENCVLEDCTVSCVGNHGVNMDDGCVGNKILDTHFYRLGAGAIRMSGGLISEQDPKESETHHNIIRNCHMEDGGLRWFSACGVAIIHGHHNEISHCSIHDFYYSGISCGFVWGYHASNTHHNIFEYNHIYNLGKGRLSDMGGIYMLGPQTGSVIRGNVIHDIKSKVYGGWALYTDEGSSNMLFEDNICYRCSDNCYHQHYGQLNVLRNNIFAFSGKGLLRISRREARLGLILENNIFYSDGSPMLENVSSAIIASDHNLFYCVSGEPKYTMFDDHVVTFDERGKIGADEHSTYSDPLFENVKEDNYTLKENSPAILLGIKPLSTSMAGCDFE